tara:strand:+ start:4664 stop:5017 length:354 start_codon:yes stop_codon:yes gene_type:complete
MIDTDKYEGHTQGPWKLRGYFSSWKIYWFDKEMSDDWDNIRDFGEEYRHEDFCHDVGVVASTEANAQLIADAPLLLEEIKRMREQLVRAKKIIHSLAGQSDSAMMDYEDYIEGDEEE